VPQRKPLGNGGNFQNGGYAVAATDQSDVQFSGPVESLSDLAWSPKYVPFAQSRVSGSQGVSFDERHL
jgi:hypothetical protein